MSLIKKIMVLFGVSLFTIACNQTDDTTTSVCDFDVTANDLSPSQVACIAAENKFYSYAESSDINPADFNLIEIGGVPLDVHAPTVDYPEIWRYPTKLWFFAYCRFNGEMYHTVHFFVDPPNDNPPNMSGIGGYTDNLPCPPAIPSFKGVTPQLFSNIFDANPEVINAFYLTMENGVPIPNDVTGPVSELTEFAMINLKYNEELGEHVWITALFPGNFQLAPFWYYLSYSDESFYRSLTLAEFLDFNSR